MPKRAHDPELDQLMMTDESKALWLKLVGIVREHHQTVIEVAEALHRIKQEQLWRAEYSTWSAFVAQEFPVGTRRIQQIAHAGKTLATIGQALRETQAGIVPSTERHGRELDRLGKDVEVQKEVWNDAVKSAGGVEPTAIQLREVVSRKLTGQTKEALRIPCPLCSACPVCHGRGTVVDENTDFSRWYQLYPRKVAPRKAKEAWVKACNRMREKFKSDNQIAVTYLLERVEAFAECVRRWPDDEQQFIPYPTTFLNQDRFDDDPAEWERRARGGALDRFIEGAGA